MIVLISAMEEDLVPYLGNEELDARAIGLFDPDSKESLSPSERRILIGLLATRGSVNATLPDTMIASEIFGTVSLCGSVLVDIRKIAARTKVLVGRCLVLIQNNPTTYEDRGYSSFNQFISDDVNGLPKITGISRNELYKAKNVAEAIPDLSLSDAQSVGWTKLSTLASKYTSSDSGFTAMLESAKTDTVDQFNERLYRSDQQIPDGSLEFGVIQVTVTKDIQKRFAEFTQDPRIRAYCGTDNTGQILERLMEEAEGVWLMENAAEQLETTLPV